VRTLADIIGDLPLLRHSNEELRRPADLERALLGMSPEEVEASDCFLMPAYCVVDSMFLELYEYELRIDLVERKDFAKHLLRLTGRATVEDAPEAVVRRQEHLFVELLPEERCTARALVLEYLDYLFYELETNYPWDRCGIEFSRENVYLQLYM
jgi:hypothetical protein